MFANSSRRVAFLACAALAAPTLRSGDPPALSAATEPAAAPEGVFNLLYRAPGAVDHSLAATAVHCSNVGAASAYLMVIFSEFDGTDSCEISSTALAAGRTVSFLTRPTTLYFEDYTCAVAPVLDQGSVRILADACCGQQVVCTVQILDPAGSPPAYSSQLELYRR